ncbi:hypothetical protein MMC11_004357 [Xylographa trunciseda]|nr:hypothetical protein [Xylographa trunciseda]
MSSEFFRIQEHIIDSQYIREYPGATRENQEEALKIHVKQYTPLDTSTILPGAVTIIGAHANGFPKELYEPLWDDIYRRSKSSGFSIRSIWIADVAQQGYSSILNEDKLGNDPSWLDFSRDLLHMTNHFRHQMPRPIVGIGHSMGGAQLVNLSTMHPRLLTTLILLDPVITNSPPIGGRGEKFNVAKASTFRRDLWPSRRAAAASFGKSPFYQRWDPRVLQLWLRYGLRDTPTAIYPEKPPEGADVPATLTTTKHQEVWTFLRPNFQGMDADGNVILNRNTHPDVEPCSDPAISGMGIFPFYRPEPASIYSKLPSLRPSVLYIFGATSNMSVPEGRRAKMQTTGIGAGGSGGANEGRVKEVVLEGVGHLVPMEAVGDSADASARWLGAELKRWGEEERQWLEARKQRAQDADIRVGEEWVKWIGGMSGPGGERSKGSKL